MESNNEKNNSVFVVSVRQVNIIASGVCILLFGAFTVGYFWNKSEQNGTFSLVKNSSENDADHINIVLDVENNVNKSESLELKNSYYAQLIGYKKEKYAENFVQKIAKQGIDLQIKKRCSKSKDSEITWYQVITSVFENKNELEAIIAQLIKQEKLHGVQIITLKETV